MDQETMIKPIARLYNDFETKFGLPRQSGIVDEIEAVIVFEPPYRDPAAVRGLAEYSHIWLLWHFSAVTEYHWSATVRPPRLGGNQRVGVFASRSPFRPNQIGLSSVKLCRIVLDEKRGPLLYVAGADLMDRTPIFDIKPYLPAFDSHIEAQGGFADEIGDYRLPVVFPPSLLDLIPGEKRKALLAVLAEDPRPAYQEDPQRIYGLPFAGFDIRFRVEEQRLTVVEVIPPGACTREVR
ncbi:MAG TPA: tRNA (N6-threonylcarbamoyladenosine(37)-N6)-methyltransferase TrmO [Clostridiales bacterium]|nr:tRNA (N6-threonylcarbamoyladenosine(37)-N6)-methyltransferase TrmO [Clostridiales bacterium]